MVIRVCLVLILGIITIVTACTRGPSPDELSAPTVQSVTINLMENEENPEEVATINNLEFVIYNPNNFEGEIVYYDLNFKDGGGSGGSAITRDNWSNAFVSTNGSTTIKYALEFGTGGKPDWMCDLYKEDLPFEVSGYIRIDFEGVKSFDVTFQGTSDS